DVLNARLKLYLPDTTVYLFYIINLVIVLASITLLFAIIFRTLPDGVIKWKDAFIAKAEKEKFPIHRPYKNLSEAQKKLLWEGNSKIKGIKACFRFMDEQSYKIQYRVLSARYKGKTECPECHGARLRGDAEYVKINGKSIHDLVRMSIENLLTFFETIQLNVYEKEISERILKEIVYRLQVLIHVGLPYLSLQRHAASLSGGEAQRIHLATSLGSALVGSMYILDEPSIGLHPRDTQKLLSVIKDLRDLGNSVIVVEHDEETILAADHIIDIGPLAGQEGGEVVFEGSPKELIERGKSLTADYLCGRKQIEIPKQRRKWKDFIELQGANQNNLKNISVKIPLQVLTVVSGVSGSGKTTLIRQTLYPALKKIYEGYGGEIGKYDCLLGDTKKIQQVELVDQNPIGRSTRSNPATYIKAFDDIRSLFADQKLAKTRGYKPGFFSFNVEGGRCDLCEGEGTIKVEMQFMADVYLECEQCKGKRFKEEVLEILYKGKNIADVLDMTVEEALAFFEEDSQNTDAKHIVEKLKTLDEVGLGYLHLGQSSNSLSGGEAQRVKLAYFLGKGVCDRPALFIFDEPTTGLHFHDINKLKKAFDALLAKGHTLVVIEHHLDIIKLADWLIDMGPEGGDKGGTILFEGVPEDLVKNKKSYTAKYLKEKLK
ncbi:MAG: excinuclease ABC subunit UvrA, partial [Bacteroidales bacterium]